MRRDLRAPARTPQENARLAAISRDDIEHARQQLRRDSERLGRMLDAAAARAPEGEDRGVD